MDRAGVDDDAARARLFGPARVQLFVLPVGLLEPTFDVDVAEDLRYLQPLALERADLLATWDALGTPGLEGQPITTP